MENQELEKRKKNSSVAMTDDYSHSTLDAQLRHAQILIDSKLLPESIKTPETVVTIIAYGNELGIPKMQALTSLFVIKGKVVLSSSIVGALAIKNGVTWKLIRDMEPIKQGEAIVDYQTTILFKRGEVEQEYSYYWNDAVRAGYTSKDNWNKYPKNMLYSRCLTSGIRIIAPDALCGLYEITEITDNLKDVSVILNDEMEVTKIIEQS